MNKARRMPVKRRRIVFICSIFLSLALCVLGLFAPSSMVSRAAGSDIDISAGNTITNYYMNITLKDKEFTLGYKGFMTVKWGDFKAWKRQDKIATIIFRFADITYADKNTNEEMAVIASTSANVNFPGSETLNRDLVINQNLEINIRETYYNYFTTEQNKGKHTRVKMSIFYEGYAVVLHAAGTGLACPKCEETCTFNLDIVLSQKEKPPGSNDPDSPDFELGDNGGATPVSRDKSLFEKFYDWLRGIFNWKMSYATFKKICIITVCVIVGLIVLSFIVKLFKSK